MPETQPTPPSQDDEILAEYGVALLDLFTPKNLDDPEPSKADSDALLVKYSAKLQAREHRIIRQALNRVLAAGPDKAEGCEQHPEGHPACTWYSCNNADGFNVADSKWRQAVDQEKAKLGDGDA